MAAETTSEILFYEDGKQLTGVGVRLEGETVWLTQHQIAELFGTTQQNVSLHVQNILDEGELDAEATHKDFLLVRREGSRNVSRRVVHYNLDMILSVGYRVKSATATRFRIWATARLKDYVVKGAAINERRLKELGSVVRILERSNEAIVGGLAEVISQYLPSLQLLQQYDDGELGRPEGTEPTWRLTYEEARSVINELAGQFQENTLFGQERGEGLKGIVEAIYQGFAGHDLYPTTEEKSANLLYLIIKDHPLGDGNKRSAAALFVTFLSRNGLLKGSGISNSALAATTLLVAMSEPREKELMISLVMNMLGTVSGD